MAIAFLMYSRVLQNFMKEKVEHWMDCVNKTSKAAVKAPPVAYSTMIKAAVKAPPVAYSTMINSLQCEWEFVQCEGPDCAETFLLLQHVITEQF